MRIDRGMVLSIAGHGAFLLWALISFAHTRPNDLSEAFPVDVLTASEFSQITAGSEQAKPQEQPKPVVEKVADPTPPVEDINAKVVEKKEVTASTTETMPEPAPKEPEPKAAAAPPEPKQETKAPEKAKDPDPKVDPIAEALKKDDTKKPEKKVEQKPQPQKKPEPQKPKFDPRKVAALLDKRDPQRLAAAGSQLNSIPSLGTAKGAAKELSASELDLLRRKLRNNWSVPPSASPDMEVRIFLTLRRDGTLASEPQVQTRGTGGAYAALRDSVIRAIKASQPFDMLRPEHYEIWHELDATFTPRDFMM
jgi:outer membrane biosynthesis protein TonB